MDDYRKRKAERKQLYDKFTFGWKKRRCTACAGSGYYDSNGSPPCDACHGTGKERYKPMSDQTPGMLLNKEVLSVLEEALDLANLGSVSGVAFHLGEAISGREADKQIDEIEQKIATLITKFRDTE